MIKSTKGGKMKKLIVTAAAIALLLSPTTIFAGEIEEASLKLQLTISQMQKIQVEYNFLGAIKVQQEKDLKALQAKEKTKKSKVKPKVKKTKEEAR